MNPALVLYNLLLHPAMALAAPLALVSAKRRLTLGQRLGLPSPARRRDPRQPLWLHALSVGEVLSAVALVAALGGRRCAPPLVFSTSTHTGQRIADQRIAGRVADLFYFPYDLPMTVDARLRQVRPRGIVLVETDLWPNFLYRAAARRIPVVLVNARLSRRSFAGYRRARALAAPMLRNLAAVAAQSADDAARFLRLGVDPERVTVAGNLKYDRPAPRDPQAEAARMRRRLRVSGHQPVLVAGSTHPGDEGPLAEACRRWRDHFPDLVCVVAPRDPRRAGAVLRTFAGQGWEGCRWSDLEGGGPRPAGLVAVDRMGILAPLYAAADLAFIGGSLARCGGHNPLEAALFGRPILYGPDMSDFAQVARDLEAVGGAVRLAGAQDLVPEGMRLLADRNRAAGMGVRARQALEAHRGAVQRTAALIEAVVCALPEQA